MVLFGDKYLSALNNIQNAIISVDAAKDKPMLKNNINGAMKLPHGDVSLYVCSLFF